MGLLSKFVSRNNIIRFLGHIKSYIDSKIEKLTNEVKLNEKVVAKSLCDLDERVSGMVGGISKLEEKVIAKSLCDLDSRIREFTEESIVGEKVIAKSLCDLDSRIREFTEECMVGEKVIAKSLCDLDYRMKDVTSDIHVVDKVVSKSLCDLDSRIKIIEDMWFLRLSDSQKETLIRILNNS